MPTALVYALVLVAGCKRTETTAPPPAPSATSSADHLTNEIPEGPERAFTLPLPLHAEIKARFKGSIAIASVHSREQLANFIRARVKDGRTTSGANETRFDDVIVTKDPSKRLTIQVLPAPLSGNYKSQIVVNDVTPPPEEPNTTDSDRWRKAGMTPDGKLLDPNHMQ